MKRREFLRRSLSAGAVVSLGDLDRLVLNAGPRTLRPSGISRKVIVAGAGLAGLAVADELIRAGHQVTVLEARLRAGGRVRTLRSFADGLYAELGAGRIPR